MAGIFVPDRNITMPFSYLILIQHCIHPFPLFNTGYRRGNRNIRSSSSSSSSSWRSGRTPSSRNVSDPNTTSSSSCISFQWWRSYSIGRYHGRSIMFRPWYRCITMNSRIAHCTQCVLSASASISLMYRCTTRRKTATRITMYDSRVPMHGQYDHHHHSQHEHDPGDIFITHASGTQIRIVTMTMTMTVMEQ